VIASSLFLSSNGFDNSSTAQKASERFSEGLLIGEQLWLIGYLIHWMGKTGMTKGGSSQWSLGGRFQ